jgi:sarcosine oxidase subunit beta
MVSEPLKPWLDPIIVSASLHVYVSQSARGELVMGAALDPYELHSTRSTLDFTESLAAHMLELFPFLSDVKINRQWAAGVLSRCRLGHVGLQGHTGLRQDYELHGGA